MTEQNETSEIDASENVIIMLVQQYAAKFGITFSSSLMANAHHRKKLVQLMGQAISGQRGAVTDADVIGDDVID
jgi:hypothetical protein